MNVQLAVLDLQISNCFSVAVQLRPHLEQDTFVDRVERQRQQGYQLAFIQVEAGVVAIAGFRMIENLAWGKILYVDDLVVDEQVRSQGYGEQLLQWLMDYGRQHQCEQLHLDSGVQRFAAHRFYFRQRLTINSYHFAVPLAPPD